MFAALVIVAASTLVSAQVVEQAPSVSPAAALSGGEQDWGLFVESILKEDRRRLKTKYKHAGNWTRGIGLSTMPTLSLPDLPDDLSSLGARGLLPLVDYGDDTFYYGSIGVGTPGQMLNVDIDTGSADLWVQSNCRGCRGPQYNQSRSRSFKSTGQGFHVQYGSGSASGTLAQDTVTIAGLTVRNQYFGVVNDPSDDFKNTPTSGLLGMAFSSIASSKRPTFFENYMKANPSIGPFFSVFLTRKQPGGSHLCLGCFDPSKVASDSGGINWLPVTSKSYWTVSMTGAAVNNVPVPATTTHSGGIFAAIDTGTTLVYVPTAFARALYTRIPGAKLQASGYYTAPCNVFASNIVSLVLNNNHFAIDMRDFNLGRVSAGSSQCVAGILGLGNGFPDDLAIVGDEFLKSWYSTYDYSRGARVGLSRSIN